MAKISITTTMVKKGRSGGGGGAGGEGLLMQDAQLTRYSAGVFCKALVW
jgi:hypothetical protein